MKSYLAFRLRGKCSNEEWKTRVILNPNDVLRQIEKKKISAIFVCSNDLKYAVHVSHFPFLCRLNGTKLITLKAGSYVELQSYFRKKNLFMFAITCDHEMMEFSKQFPEIESFDAATLPLTTIKK